MMDDRHRRASAFDRAIGRAAPPLSVRAETASDNPFLHGLFVRCSPLAGVLPAAMLDQQAGLHERGHRRDFPDAMRRVAIVDGQPVGRLVIDWAAACSWCVDVAVLPDRAGAGIGTSLLRAWLAVADAAALPTGLTVRRDNPAWRLYARLGFVAASDDDPDAPHATLRRPVVG